MIFVRGPVIATTRVGHYSDCAVGRVNVPSLILVRQTTLTIHSRVLGTLPVCLDRVIIITNDNGGNNSNLTITHLLGVTNTQIAVLGINGPSRTSRRRRVRTRVYRCCHVPRADSLDVLSRTSLVISTVFNVNVSQPITKRCISIVGTVGSAGTFHITISVPSKVGASANTIVKVTIGTRLAIAFTFGGVKLARGRNHRRTNHIIVTSSVKAC